MDICFTSIRLRMHIHNNVSQSIIVIAISLVFGTLESQADKTTYQTNSGLAIGGQLVDF